METTGKLTGASRTFDGRGIILTFEVDASAASQIENMKANDLLRIKAVKYREKRSNDANAYAWVLMTKIANHPDISSSKEDVYEEMLQKYGSFYEDDNGYVTVTLKKEVDVSLLGGHWKRIREFVKNGKVSDGQITADIVKNAMFAAADDIDAKFNSMPMTWGQLWTYYSNQALMTFQPVLQRLNEMANDQHMQTALTGIMNALSGAATIALNVIDVMVTGGAYIVDNWSMIAPVIGGVAAALAIYNGALLLHNAYEAASNGLKMIAAIRSVAHGTATAAEAAATTGASAAQIAFNAALYACPLTWIVLAIIAVIAAIYLVVAAINKVQGTTYSATGVVAGIFATLGAHIINTFVVPAWNGFATLANFFGNVFNNPVAAVEVMFYDLCLTVLGYISNLASAIQTLLNKIPGVEVNITSGLDGFYSKLEEAQQAVKDKSGWVEQVGKMDYVDYQTAYNKGYDFGQGVENKVSDFFGGIKDLGNSGDTGALGSYGAASDMAANVANIAGDTSSISDSLDVSEEDLKYLRDITEQEAINRFTTAEIKVDMSGMSNTVHNTNDLDGIVDGLTTRVLEAMEIVRDGA